MKHHLELYCAVIILTVSFIIFGPISTSISKASTNEVYTISCETPQGWVDYRTYKSPSESYHSRAGIWILTLDSGNKIYSNNCFAKE